MVIEIWNFTSWPWTTDFALAPSPWKLKFTKKNQFSAKQMHTFGLRSTNLISTRCESQQWSISKCSFNNRNQIENMIILCCNALTFTNFLLVIGIAAPLLVEIYAVAEEKRTSYSSRNAQCCFIYFHVVSDIEMNLNKKELWFYEKIIRTDRDETILTDFSLWVFMT